MGKLRHHCNGVWWQDERNSIANYESVGVLPVHNPRNISKFKLTKQIPCVNMSDGTPTLLSLLACCFMNHFYLVFSWFFWESQVATASGTPQNITRCRTCQKLERLQRQFEHGAGGAEPDAPDTQRSSIRLWMVIQWMEELLQLRGSLTIFNPLFIGFQQCFNHPMQEFCHPQDENGDFCQQIMGVWSNLSIHPSTYLPFGNPIYGSYAESNAGKLAWQCLRESNLTWP